MILIHIKDSKKFGIWRFKDEKRSEIIYCRFFECSEIRSVDQIDLDLLCLADEFDFKVIDFQKPQEEAIVSQIKLSNYIYSVKVASKNIVIVGIYDGEVNLIDWKNK